MLRINKKNNHAEEKKQNQNKQINRCPCVCLIQAPPHVGLPLQRRLLERHAEQALLGLFHVDGRQGRVHVSRGERGVHTRRRRIARHAHVDVGHLAQRERDRQRQNKKTNKANRRPPKSANNRGKIPRQHQDQGRTSLLHWDQPTHSQARVQSGVGKAGYYFDGASIQALNRAVNNVNYNATIGRQYLSNSAMRCSISRIRP